MRRVQRAKNDSAAAARVLVITSATVLLEFAFVHCWVATAAIIFIPGARLFRCASSGALARPLSDNDAPGV